MSHSTKKRAWLQAMHTYDDRWRPLSWLIPHNKSQPYQLNPYRHAGPDHPDWGVPLFCCPLAVYTLALRWPKQISPETSYYPIPGVDIIDALKGTSPDWLHFILCDPQRLHHLRLISIIPEGAQSILKREVSLCAYWEHTVEYT